MPQNHLIYLLLLWTLCASLCANDGVPEQGEIRDTLSIPQIEVPQVKIIEEITVTDAPTATALGDNVTHPIVAKIVQCHPFVGPPEVQLVNDTELMKLLLPQANITTRETPADCVLVLFFSKFCPFSSMAAPHFNALPRAFPEIKMVAINAMVYHLFNTQNGIVGVPTLMLFHNGRPMAKFNDSEYTLELFSKFLTRHTAIEPPEKMFVTSADFSGPVSSVPAKDFDTFLIISWLFIGLCSCYYFTKTRFWGWIVETVQSNWRESEAHAHVD